MMMTTHVESATGILSKVLLSRPDYLALKPINKIASDWLLKGEEIDVIKALKEHDQLIDIYKKNDVTVEVLKPTEHLSSMVFARDFGFCVKEGVVLGRFKEHIRRPETELYAEKLKSLGIPIIARCTEGYIEGGDFWQLDERTLAMGKLQRSNTQGIDNLRSQLEPYGYQIIEVAANPAYLHLDMIFNIVSEKTAVAYWDGLPDHFKMYLTSRGYDIIHIDEIGVFKHFANLQALGDGKIISLKSNVQVNEQLRLRGFTIYELDSTEILKTGGGPHCMTFPLERR